MQYCRCLQPLRLREALSHLKEETVELWQEPSLDELSDCAFGIGRLVAALFGKVYFRMPLDGRHVHKIQARMAKHGCIRSERHLVEGHCPCA